MNPQWSDLPEVPAKPFFTRQEAAELVGVPERLLRQWEREFAVDHPRGRTRRFFAAAKSSCCGASGGCFWGKNGRLPKSATRNYISPFSLKQRNAKRSARRQLGAVETASNWVKRWMRR
ncbi:MerR family transcriptional regulator [Hydrogenophilus thermoluteolus]|uniref:MerR family transcriptional regulator n=1 Tax=Hydrogenophilus thermoluteolus TaxID=297 RepID=UPI003F68085B